MERGRVPRGKHAFALVVSILAVSFVLARPVAAKVTPWGDSQGDVALAGADLVAGLAAVDQGTVYLRASFAEIPFPNTATHFVDWCLDLDQDPSTGTVCGGINGYLLGGADAAVAVDNVPPRSPPMTIEVKREGAAPVPEDVASTVIVDAATNSLCVMLPLSLFADDGTFDYVVASIFGGSLGQNDAAPDAPAFAAASGFFTSETGDPGPCGASDAEDPSGGPGDPTDDTAGPTGDPSDPPGNTGTRFDASMSAQTPWWIALAIVVSFALAILGVALRRRKQPPRADG